MEIAISLKDLGMVVLFVALLVLIIYLIVCIKNVINVLKKADLVLDDVNEISTIAAHRTAQVDGAIDSAVVKISNALCSIASTLRREKKASKEESPQSVDDTK